MKSRKHAVPVFLLLTLSLLFSCGKKEEEQASADMATPLSILAPDAYKTAIERVKSKMKGAELSVTAYPAEERESVHTRMQIAYMAGEGYDVFFLDGQPVWNYAQGGYLADFYEIIEEDAGTDIDDFYTNVLKAFEYNGKLYMFPLSFGFDYIGINAKLPGEYIERFSRYETISNREVLRIYNDLRNEYAEDFKSLSLSNAEYLNEPYSAIDHALVNYIDMDNKSASINDRRFLETLGEVKQKYDGMNLFAQDRYLMTIPIASRKELSAYANAYIFLVDALYLNPVNALFSPKDPRFVHYIPIADEEGRLMIDKDWRAGSSWGSLCISAFADKPLAWAFTRELLSVSVNYIPSYTADDINGVGIHSMSTPIKKSYYRSHAVTAINQSMDKGRETQTFNGFEEDKRDETINGVLARLDAYNNMPAAISPPIPPDLYKDALDAYLLEPSTPLSAQKAAEDINNKISLWLMETAG